MANYAGANLVDGQAKLFGKFNEDARKSENPVTYLKYVENTEIMIPSHKELRTRDDRTVDSFTFARSKRSLTTGRTFNHTGVHGDTLTLTPSFTTRTDKFEISLKQADNNIYSRQEQFENELVNVVKNFMDDQEENAIDHTFANRSQINVGNAIEGSFDVTDFVYKITESTFGERAAQITDTIMQENFLKGGLILFCDSAAFDKFRFQAAQGISNATNLSFQFDNKTFVRSIGLDNGSRFGGLVTTYNKGVWIAVPMGSIAHLDWIPKQNRKGTDTKEQRYGTIINPFDDLDYAIHDYATRANGTSVNGFTQDELEQVEISIDSAFVSSPLTTANETVFQAFALI